MNGKKYRLGLDLGESSLGWAEIEVDTENHPIGLLDMGVRIFKTDATPKAKNPKLRYVAWREVCDATVTDASNVFGATSLCPNITD